MNIIIVGCGKVGEKLAEQLLIENIKRITDNTEIEAMTTYLETHNTKGE